MLKILDQGYSVALVLFFWALGFPVAGGSEIQHRGVGEIVTDTTVGVTDGPLKKDEPSIDVFVPGNPRVLNAVFSDDGRYLATTDGCQVTIWDAENGQQIKTFSEPEANVEIGEGWGWNAIAFAHRSGPISGREDAVRVIGDGSNHVLAVHTLESIPSIVIGHTPGELTGDPLVVSADGRLVAFSGPRTWNSRTRRREEGFATVDLAKERVRSKISCSGAIDVSTDQRYALCAPSVREYGPNVGDHSLRLVDLRLGREVARLIGHQHRVTAGGFVGNESLAFSASHDGTVRIWEVPSGKSMQVIKIQDPIAYKGWQGEPKISGVTAAQISDDGRFLAVRYSERAAGDKRISDATALWDRVQGLKLRDLTPLVPPFRFSPDGTRLLAIECVSDDGFNLPGCDQPVMLRLDRSADEIRLQRFPELAGTARALGFSSDGKKVFYQLGWRTAVLDVDTASLEFIAPPSAPLQLLSANGRYLLRVGPPDGGPGERPEWNRGMYPTEPHNPTHPIPAGEFVVTTMDLEADIVVGRVQLRAGQEEKGALGSEKANEPVSTLIAGIADDGARFATVSGDGVASVWNTRSGRKLRSVDLGVCEAGRVADRNVVYLCRARIGFSRDLSRVVAMRAESPKERILHIFDMNTGEMLSSYDPGERAEIHWSVWCGDAPKFSPDNQHFATSHFSCEAEGTPKPASPITVFSLKQAEFTVEPAGLERHHVTEDVVRWAPDGKTVWFAGGGTVVALDAQKGEVLRAANLGGGHYSRPAISVDGKRVADTVGIWNVETGEQIVALTVLEDGEDWVAVTPEGYYSSSQDGHRYVKIRRGGAVYRIDQFYDVFYRPDIVGRKLHGEPVDNLVTLTVDEAIQHPPPRVEILTVVPERTDSKRVKLGYRITSDGGGIGEVRVRQNGKLIYSDGQYGDFAEEQRVRDIMSITSDVLTREMRQITRAKRGLREGKPITEGVLRTPAKGNRYEGEIEIEAIPGNNEISVVAFNAQNSIRSLWKTVRFTSTLPPEPSDLYVLAIGIDQYRYSSQNLKFAVKDARAFAERVRIQSASLYPEKHIIVETLVDEEATRAGILRKLEALSTHIRHMDHFILFVASHGILSGDQYSIITHDYNGRVTADSRISSNEIVDSSKRIKALNQLLVFDTCHAGGVDHVVNNLYDARLSVLAKRMGLHIYASASPTEQALDGYEENGLFTHALLKGLDNNRSADSNRNREVSVVELGNYARDRTVALSRENEVKQTPVIIQFGQDRPMYRLQVTDPPVSNEDAAMAVPASETPDLVVSESGPGDHLCDAGYLDGRLIRQKLAGNTVSGKTITSGQYWEEFQGIDGIAYFQKSGGKKIQGRWRFQDDQICWCYGRCAKWGCKQIELDRSCTAWYVDPVTGVRASQVLAIQYEKF